MSYVIKFFYKDQLVSVMAVSNELRRVGWEKHQPPFQPDNWDRWELAPGGCAQCD